MKKIFYIFSVALAWAAVSCTQEKTPVDTDTPEGYVTFVMGVRFPETFVTTKGAIGADPDIDNIYVATFGDSHYLNDYVKAEPCNADGTTTGASFGTVENDKDFYFKVTLVATQTYRKVHVIANGPSYLDYNKYETDIMKELTTEGGNAAYWTCFELKSGTANADGTASAAAMTAFSNIRLVRNFARFKVSVSDDVKEYFEFAGYKIVNVPTHGSVAIWKETSDPYEFFTDYASKTFDELLAEYPNGFIPNDEINTTAPTASDTDYTTDDKYVYECPDRATNKLYISIKGKYRNDTDYTYYRLDLVDRDGNYLPVYRNYQYNITLTSVAKSGAANPADAKPSNANVSSLTETENLSDIADGVSRMYVQWLDYTYMASGTQSNFRYMYLKDAANDTQSTLATLEVTSGKGEAITSDFTQTLGTDGWYTVSFSTDAPGDAEKITKFRVTGKTDDGQKLYRDITVHVLGFQDFGTPSVTSGGSSIGTTVTVTITLPTGLPSSIFPLEIAFEDNQKRLNPLGIDMPAQVGTSIVAGNSNTSYQFVKSVSYLDYAGDGGSNVVTCEFRRISEGATILYMDNEYFNKTSVSISGE